MRAFAQKPGAVRQTTSDKSMKAGRASHGQSPEAAPAIHLRRAEEKRATPPELGSEGVEGNSRSAVAATARFGHDFSLIPVRRRPQRARAGDEFDTPLPPVVREVVGSPGRPLDTATHLFMAQRFGRDFGRVRIHADSKASESARAVNALAYTVGRDVVFGHGLYAPETPKGRRLLAHELAHVVQQSVGGSAPEMRPDAAHERSAEAAAAALGAGRARVNVTGSTGVGLSRQSMDVELPPPVQRIVYIDAQVLNEYLSRGSQAVADAINGFQNQGVEMRMTREQYEELVTNNLIPRMQTANRRLITELGIIVDVTPVPPQAFQQAQALASTLRGSPSGNDLRLVVAAQLAGGEVFALDRVFVNQPAAIQRFGTTVAPEAVAIGNAMPPAPRDYRTARSIMGLPPIEISLSGRVRMLAVAGAVSLGAATYSGRAEAAPPPSAVSATAATRANPRASGTPVSTSNPSAQARPTAVPRATALPAVAETAPPTPPAPTHATALTSPPVQVRPGGSPPASPFPSSPRMAAALVGGNEFFEGLGNWLAQIYIANSREFRRQAREDETRAWTAAAREAVRRARQLPDGDGAFARVTFLVNLERISYQVESVTRVRVAAAPTQQAVTRPWWQEAVGALFGGAPMMSRLTVTIPLP